MTPQVHPFHHAATGTWSYVVADPATAQAAIVDPVRDFDARSGRTGHRFAQQLLECVHDRSLRVHWLLETHIHADHLSAAAWLRAQFPEAKIAIGVGVREAQQTFAPVFDLEGSPAGEHFDCLLGEDDVFALGSLAVRTIAVPGHTRDSLAYLIGDALFVGDSLLLPNAGTARCDFPGGDAAMLYRSIRRLYELPDETRVFVGHDYGTTLDGNRREVACETTIGEQKHRNVHVHEGMGEAGFVALRQARDATLDLPALLLPSLQVNLRGGALPDPSANGIRYLRLPLDQFRDSCALNQRDASRSSR